MAKFTKKRRGRKSHSQYSSAYVEERRKELNELLAKAKTPEDREMLRKAFDVSIRPFNGCKNDDEGGEGCFEKREKN